VQKLPVFSAMMRAASIMSRVSFSVMPRPSLGTICSLAPRIFMCSSFSRAKASEVTICRGYPFTAQIRESDTPVLPPVYSTTEPCAVRRPSASAASITANEGTMQEKGYRRSGDKNQGVELTAKSNRRLAPAEPGPRLPKPAELKKQYSPGRSDVLGVTLYTPGRNLVNEKRILAFWSVPLEVPNTFEAMTTVSRE